MSKLYVVATPIGNLFDFAQRGQDVLSRVNLILSEDTRITRKLLSHFDIHTELESFHAHSENKKYEKVLNKLEADEDLALVSDAGTPTISDPGSRLVTIIRDEFPEVEIIGVSGSSAVTTALSVSGLPASDFLFLGFLPRKKGRKSKIKEITESKYTVVLYESPYRVQKLLAELEENLSPDRTVVVSKELTKVHEQTVSGTPKEVLQYFEDNQDKVRGEFVVMVNGK